MAIQKEKVWFLAHFKLHRSTHNPPADLAAKNNPLPIRIVFLLHKINMQQYFVSFLELRKIRVEREEEILRLKANGWQRLIYDLIDLFIVAKQFKHSNLMTVLFVFCCNILSGFEN